jgi:hypothetical protein
MPLRYISFFLMTIVVTYNFSICHLNKSEHYTYELTSIAVHSTIN